MGGTSGAAGFRLADLARLVGGRVVGDGDRVVTGVATLEAAAPEHLTFLANPRYRRAAETTKAGAILLAPGSEIEGRDLLLADHPYLALAGILEAFHPDTPPPGGVSPDARVGQGVHLGRDVSVGPFAVVGDGSHLADGVVVGAGCVLGEECVIGEGSRLHPRVVVYPRTRLGARCIVHSGAVLGADGFGFATKDGVHRKIPQVGRVILEDDVEVGANSAVDRGALGDTVVGRGTKIDDLVMLAHGVRVGAGGLIAAQAGVAGSAELGARVTLAGQSGCSGHIRIGDDVVVAAKTAVFDDVASGQFVAGVPATDHRAWKRAVAALKDLPRLRAEVRRLRDRMESLERERSERSEEDR
jgi:UDP-3-O-[3-hydroxymyristoyl] glucosamine N-acyltransferase